MSEEKARLLEETRIWQKYDEATNETSYTNRKNKVLQIYEKSRDILAEVSKTFPNYTLHNEKHILNVLTAMSGILGEKIDELSIEELEVLIIVASLHDVGMTYTDKQEKDAFSDPIQIEHFIKECYPGEYELDPDNWSENMRQNYLRYLHPYRVKEIIKTEAWNEIFDSWPVSMVGIDTIVEICQAHGMTLEEIQDNERLKYIKSKKTDALFCAMLLRLADLLDFDDSRAPTVLFDFAKDNEKSCEEFEKHMASGGFTYPEIVSEEDLPFYASCPSPKVEHIVNVFLDWIDEELQNCRCLQDKFKPKWKSEMAFPRQVSREEIETLDFLAGEYSLKLNFDQIMKLLSGEELYSQKDVFVRELLQNAIDATLLRAKMDNSFCVEEAKIEMWEWTDSEGRWFRIDDCGTGMTLGMIKKYFLSVGSSYYNSQELKRDLSKCDFPDKTEYTGISKFGIGFLSCFLCGSYAEISTLHFDESKCCKEYKNTNRTTKYGIRLEMGQKDRFYTIRCQANGNSCPTPLPCEKKDEYGSEYRNKYGTSIVIKLDTTKLENIDIKEAAESIIFGTKMPIFFNGERIGETRNELIEKYEKLANNIVTENLTDTEKEEFDKAFPEYAGKYPVFVKEYQYFDSKTEIGIDGFTEIIEKQSIHLNDEVHIIRGVPCKLGYDHSEDSCMFGWEIVDIDEISSSYRRNRPRLFKSFKERKSVRQQLIDYYDSCPECPSLSDLGELKEYFEDEESLRFDWRIYLKNSRLSNSWKYKYKHEYTDSMVISYKGIVQGTEDIDSNFDGTNGVLLLDEEWRPRINVARSVIIRFPLEVKLLVDFLSYDFKNCCQEYSFNDICETDISIDMNNWRELMSSEVGVWLKKQMREHLNPNSEFYLSYFDEKKAFDCDSVLRSFIEAYCLDNYLMKVSYSEHGGNVKAIEKESHDYGILPPMLLCRASDEYTKRFVKSLVNDPAINMDHYFVKWFIENADVLRRNFNTSYFKICEVLRSDFVSSLIDETNTLALQIEKYGEHCNIKSDIPKKLSAKDIYQKLSTKDIYRKNKATNSI